MFVESDRSRPDDSTNFVCRGGSGNTERGAGLSTEFVMARSSLPRVSPHSFALMFGLTLDDCVGEGCVVAAMLVAECHDGGRAVQSVGLLYPCFLHHFASNPRSTVVQCSSGVRRDRIDAR